MLNGGHNVHSIDCLESMAKLAVKRNSVETEVINFLHLNATNEYRTVIINTGVIYPEFIKRCLCDFVNKINEVLMCEGVLLLSFFRKTDFDKTVLDLKLHKDERLLVEIWRGLNSGRNIFEVLLSRHQGIQGIEYLLCQHREELEEYEGQIRNAGRRFKSYHNSRETEKFISKVLPYVSFGLGRSDQLSLFHLLKRFSIKPKEVYNAHNATCAVLEKSIGS